MSEEDGAPPPAKKPRKIGYVNNLPPKKPKVKKPNREGIKDRGRKYAKQLREFNVHKPARSARKADVIAVKELQASLRETWVMMREKADEFRRFSRRQQEFARHYALNGRTNMAEAMRLAGYNAARGHKMWEMAKYNLAQPGFEELIKAYELEEKARMKLCVQDVADWFQDIAKAAMATEDFTNANRAMENLAKYLGMFIERKEVTHTVIQSREDLDNRIAELTSILKEASPEIDAKLRIN